MHIYRYILFPCTDVVDVILHQDKNETSFALSSERTTLYGELHRHEAVSQTLSKQMIEDSQVRDVYLYQGLKTWAKSLAQSSHNNSIPFLLFLWYETKLWAMDKIRSSCPTLFSGWSMVFPIELALYGWVSFIWHHNLNLTRDKAQRDKPGSLGRKLNALSTKPPLL